MTEIALTANDKTRRCRADHSTAGQCYFREAGVEHGGINANDLEFVFMEIEFR